MNNQTRVTRTFSLPPQSLFSYFSEESLLERWSFPEGMSLRIPVFEPEAGGSFRYEHTVKEGTFAAEGYFKEFGPRSIVQAGLTVTGPDGKVLFENLECRISFLPKAKETEVQILQTGFKTEKDASDCEKGWQQSFDHLESLIREEANEAAS